jgi:hypothetical protein
MFCSEKTSLPSDPYPLMDSYFTSNQIATETAFNLIYGAKVSWSVKPIVTSYAVQSLLLSSHTINIVSPFMAQSEG